VKNIHKKQSISASGSKLENAGVQEVKMGDGGH
jgi:hypothetical protein